MQYSVTSIQPLRLLKKVMLKLIVLFAFLSFSEVSAQYEIPEKPDFQTSVYDYVNLLSASEKNTLENKLVKYSDSTSTQIVVAIIASTKGEYINYLATKWAHKWGIGQAKEDNGVLEQLNKKVKTLEDALFKQLERPKLPEKTQPKVEEEPVEVKPKKPRKKRQSRVDDIWNIK